MIDHAQLRSRARAELTENILPFWSTVAVDAERGGLHGSVSNTLLVDDSVERTAVLCARELWTFSAAAYRLQDRHHLKAADDAYGYLCARFIDPVHGGVFWSVDQDGSVVDGRKQVYAQAFAVYALAEYARARGDHEPLVVAASIVNLVERHATDAAHGGYLEARGRDWGPIDDVRLSPKEVNAPKSMNTHLHVMEAYTTLLEVTGDEHVRERLSALIRTVLDHVVTRDSRSFGLFFTNEWRPLSTTVSYGHDIEGAWLLTAAANGVGEAELIERAERVAVALAGAVIEDGRDVDGAVLYEFRPASAHSDSATDRDSHWWVQAEGAVGFLDAYRITGEERFLEATATCWGVIEAHHIDRVHGDWFKVLDPQRHPRQNWPKVGPWECPYHHARACLELIRRLPATSLIEEGPTT